MQAVSSSAPRGAGRKWSVRSDGRSADAGQEWSSPRERNRRLFVRCVFLLFALLLTEGVFRKWVFPHFSQYLFFIRDPVVLFAYAVALRNGAFRPWHPLLVVGLAFSLLVLPIVVVQAGSGFFPNPVLFASYGWRNYFLYIPLPFAIATQFRQRDLYRLCRFAIIAMIIIAPLAVAQFFAAPGAMINVGISEDSTFQFTNLGSAGGHIRPPGTFTSILGMVELTSSALAIVLACWILPREERPASSVLMVLGAVAAAASIAVSGSRTMLFHVGMVVAGSVLSGPLMRRPALIARATTFPALLTVAFVALLPVVLPEGYETLATRWNQASAQEHGVSNRVFVELEEFTWLLRQAPLVGYGLGLGGDAAKMIQSNNTASAAPYSETDWAHHIVDLGPILGILFIVYRAIFTLWLAYSAVVATQRARNPLPVLLFGYVGVVLMQGQIAGNGVENGFCWLFVGFCMAACRVTPETAAEPAAETDYSIVGVRPPNLMT